jgi:hypothetical protein
MAEAKSNYESIRNLQTSARAITYPEVIFRPAFLPVK